MHKYGSSFSWVQRVFSKMKLVKTLFCTQLSQANRENWLHISTESQKGFKDAVFQHSVDELKHCNPDVRMELKLVRVFLCLYSI